VLKFMTLHQIAGYCFEFLVVSGEYSGNTSLMSFHRLLSRTTCPLLWVSKKLLSGNFFIVAYGGVSHNALGKLVIHFLYSNRSKAFSLESMEPSGKHLAIQGKAISA